MPSDSFDDSNSCIPDRPTDHLIIVQRSTLKVRGGSPRCNRERVVQNFHAPRSYFLYERFFTNKIFQQFFFLLPILQSDRIESEDSRDGKANGDIRVDAHPCFSMWKNYFTAWRKIWNRNLFAYSMERNSNTHRYPRASSHGVVGEQASE